ncbi:RNA-binding protein 1 [Taenia solium]
MKQHFAQYGTVTECRIARDWETGKSKGFGFVTFQRRAQAARALSDSPHLIEDGFVHVRPFKSKTNKEDEVEKSIVFSAIDEDKKVGNKGDGNDAVAKGKVNELRLFVGNLNPSTTQQALKKYFSRYGTITSVDMILERENGKPRGIAFVNMTTPLEVEAVLNAGPHQLSGKNIVVRRAFSEAATSNDAESGQLVIVNNIPSFWSKDDIQFLFSRFGVITNVRVDEEVGKALIEFSTAQAVDNLRKQKFNHIIEKYYLTSPSDGGTCRIISDF